MGSFRFVILDPVGSGIGMCWLASLVQGNFHLRLLFNLFIFHAVPDVMFFPGGGHLSFGKVSHSRLQTGSDRHPGTRSVFLQSAHAGLFLPVKGRCVWVCARVCLRERKKDDAPFTHSESLASVMLGICLFAHIWLHFWLRCCRSSNSLSTAQQGASPPFQTIRSNPF